MEEVKKSIKLLRVYSRVKNGTELQHALWNHKVCACNINPDSAVPALLTEILHCQNNTANANNTSAVLFLNNFDITFV